VTLLPHDQRTLLKIERSLRKDPAVKAALEAFTFGYYRRKGPTRECLSPWHPVLWQAMFGVLIALTVALMAIIVVAALRAS
jgi:hypothetical protein